MPRAMVVALQHHSSEINTLYLRMYSYVCIATYKFMLYGMIMRHAKRQSDNYARGDATLKLFKDEWS